MHVAFDPAVEAFRIEVRRFLADAMAPERTARHADPADLTGLDEEFERALLKEAGSRGYLALDLPPEAGGAGLTRAHRAAFAVEAAGFDAPLIDTAVTLGGASIARFGSNDQHATLRRMARGDETLCIAYTEAQAGSDLTAMATTATRGGDVARDELPDDADWEITGTKVLVTGAHKADWCLLVARTDPAAPANAAMSMFLVPMRNPGITVQRVRTANDWTLGEIRFVGARVPAGTLLGTQGRGFAQMAAALADERSGFFWVGWAAQRLADLLGHVRRVGPGGCALPDAATRDLLARLWIDVALARALAMRVVTTQGRGDDASVAAAISKVFVTELLQHLASAGVALLGPAGLLTAPRFGAPDDGAPAPLDGRFAYECVERLHPTISVGSNEIQRDLLAHRGLGLPVS